MVCGVTTVCCTLLHLTVGLACVRSGGVGHGPSDSDGRLPNTRRRMYVGEWIYLCALHMYGSRVGGGCRKPYGVCEAIIDLVGISEIASWVIAFNQSAGVCLCPCPSLYFLFLFIKCSPLLYISCVTVRVRLRCNMCNMSILLMTILLLESHR